MSRKRFAILVSLGIIIFGILLYWNALRPSFIKKECFRLVTEQTKGKSTYDLDKLFDYCSKARGL